MSVIDIVICVSAPPTATDTAAGLIGVLGPLQRTLRKRAREDWPLEPLATAQVELLRTVRRRPGVSVGEAAAELRVAPNTASTLANQLVAAGLVRRRPDARDRRTVRLAVTDAAEQRMAAWNDRRQQLLDAALARLGPGEREALRGAVGPLERLLEALGP
jgi:DNA-binding MarR family transcriptional regulator